MKLKKKKKCHGSTDSMGMSLSKLPEGREAWRAAVHGLAKSWAQLNDWIAIHARFRPYLLRVSSLVAKYHCHAIFLIHWNYFSPDYFHFILTLREFATLADILHDFQLPSQSDLLGMVSSQIPFSQINIFTLNEE